MRKIIVLLILLSFVCLPVNAAEVEIKFTIEVIGNIQVSAASNSSCAYYNQGVLYIFWLNSCTQAGTALGDIVEIEGNIVNSEFIGPHVNITSIQVVTP